MRKMTETEGSFLQKHLNPIVTNKWEFLGVLIIRILLFRILY